MNSILRQTGVVAIALGLLAAPAFAAGAPGTPAPGAGPADAAGSVGVPGSTSVTGANASPTVNGKMGTQVDTGLSDNGSSIDKSQAELPNNDAGTPINNGPHGVGNGSMNGNLNPPNTTPRE